jgi:hypothetical protein
MCAGAPGGRVPSFPCSYHVAQCQNQFGTVFADDDWAAVRTANATSKTRIGKRFTTRSFP